MESQVYFGDDGALGVFGDDGVLGLFGLSNATFIVIVLYIFYAPQGDAFQKGTEAALYCTLLLYRRLEVQGDLYHKVPSCKVIKWN